MKIRVEETPIRDLVVVHPEVFGDQRGFFLEAFRGDVLAQHGLPGHCVQVNHSGSARNVVRGLHFQFDPPMGKLMRPIRGEAFLVAVDIRHGSPTLGHWFGRRITTQSRAMMWAPAGFARGFCALSDETEIEYFCTGTYNGPGESGVAWNDPAIGIEWPVPNPILSDRDGKAQSLREWLARPESRRFTY